MTMATCDDLPLPELRRGTKPLHRFILLSIVLARTAAASAQSSFTPSAVFLQAGTSASTHAVTAGLEWDWGRQWDLGGGAITGYWEASLAGWIYPKTKDRGNAWIGQVGLTPMFRYRPAGGLSPWFGEAGIGLTLLTNTYETRRRRFSTDFNFGDQIAVGRSFGTKNEHEIALRIEHFSNGGIKEPNPGINFIQLRYTYRLPD